MTAEKALIELMWRKRYNVQFPTKLLLRKLFDEARFSDSAKYDDIELMPRILAGANRIAFHGLPKYTFCRHEDNNSAWTTNHSLLTSETLDEYLQAYRERTVMLSEMFPGSAAAWRYFEWSFMISMVEKVTRLKIKGCELQHGAMMQTLWKNREEFMNCEYILNFEKSWINKYITDPDLSSITICQGKHESVDGMP
jgi:hypothetical protein